MHSTKYERANFIMRSITKEVLREYIHTINWKTGGGDVVMDIGCATGDVTSDILKPLLPTNHKQLIGVDISEDLVKHAASKYTSTMKFDVLDVETAELIDKYGGTIDHIFSFFCIHWLKDQKHVFQNFHEILNEKGDMLLIFAIDAPLFDVIITLSKNESWKPYMEDADNYIGSYYGKKNARDIIENLLKQTGFDQIIVDEKLLRRKFPNDSVIKTYEAVYPFADRIPEKLKDLYRNDVVRLLKEFSLSYETDEETEVIIHLEYIVISARKLQNQ